MERTRLQAELQRLQGLQRVYQSQRFEAQQALELAQRELATLRQQDPASERFPDLAREITGPQAALRQPFEYEPKLVEIQEELGRIEREIARLNRPPPRRKGLLGRLFEWGGRG